MSDPNIKKKIARIKASVPDVTTCNPIAALINFSKYQLSFEVDFRSWESSDGLHTVKIYFPNEEFISEAADRKKKTAKEDCAKKALVRLNNEPELLDKLIEWALAKDGITLTR